MKERPRRQQSVIGKPEAGKILSPLLPFQYTDFGRLYFVCPQAKQHNAFARRLALHYKRISY